MTMTEAVDGIYTTSENWGGMVREDVPALLAATFPVKPPRGWFANPQLTEITPLTVQSDGRVLGHVATWKQTHIGLAGGVRAPRSLSGYAFFATGALECDDGSMVNVGQITLTGGHAPLEASVAEAVAHYDDTRSAVMDIAVGEDDIGIWAAGALRPDVNELQLRAIRAASISGDWRPINGNLELVAVCAVNVPGFPTPRARVSSGQVVALVAAGTEELVACALFDRLGVDMRTIIASATNTLDRRLALVEDALLDRVRERRQGFTAALERLDPNPNPNPVNVEELRARVRPNKEALIAGLRDRVHPDDEIWADGMEINLSTGECIQASLRARVNGGLVARATRSWNAESRREAAKKGQALPDGSFPITNKTDWNKARQALGRANNRAKVIRHLKKRGRALGVPKKDMDALGELGVNKPKAS